MEEDMRYFTPEQKIHYTLRFAIALCFFGHGSFGIITKAIWCNYFGVFGIGQALAYRLMPIVGAFDILAGLIVLARPMRVIPAWLVAWGFVTALLRPLSGEPFAEFIERAGNFGAPLVFLLLAGGRGLPLRKWFARIDPDIHAGGRTRTRLLFCLRVIVFLLLAGHGWLNLIEKKGLLVQYTSLGFSDPVLVAKAAGLFEIAAAFAVLIRPVAPLVMILIVWKITSELFYPHYEFFEWIERAGSYGCLLALWFALRWSHHGSRLTSSRISGYLRT